MARTMPLTQTKQPKKLASRSEKTMASRKQSKNHKNGSIIAEAEKSLGRRRAAIIRGHCSIDGRGTRGIFLARAMQVAKRYDQTLQSPSDQADNPRYTSRSKVSMTSAVEDAQRIPALLSSSR